MTRVEIGTCGECKCWADSPDGEVCDNDNVSNMLNRYIKTDKNFGCIHFNRKDNKPDCPYCGIGYLNSSNQCNACNKIAKEGK